MSIALIGNGGLGREIKSYMDVIGIRSRFFVSDEFYSGSPNTSRLSELDIEEHSVLICIADVFAKEKIKNSLPKETRYFTFIHPSAQIYTKNKIGDGSIICPNAVITSDVEIGNHVLINVNSTIGHDTHIGNFCTINPNTSVAGNCNIQDFVFIGSGSSIKEKLTIVDNTIVGMGAVVVKDILKSGTYIGVPSREMYK